MNSHSDQNEGIRILEEFVCQAIHDPGLLAASSEPAASGKEHELEVMVADPRPVSAVLVGEDGRLKDRIEIGKGVALWPQFPSLQRAGTVGGNEALTFALNNPDGIALNLVAAALYDWMTKHGVRWARANGVEVTVSDTATKDVPIIAQALSQKAAECEPDEPQ